MATDIGAPPLAGIKVVEIAGLGPAPLACLMLAELGADVIRIEPSATRAQSLPLDPDKDLDRQGRQIIRLDLKTDQGRAAFLDLASVADVLVEGLRPGVMERLGLGPDDLANGNPKLIYGRMTGYGQDGPLAKRAGHDLNYIALTGVLNAIGQANEKPAIPLNLIGDYGGGTMFLLVGVLAALFERERSGKGQTIDAAMVDGASMLAATLISYIAQGVWRGGRGANMLDGGCPFYDTYETSDGKFIAVACLEPQFFAEFARLLPLDADLAASQHDRRKWPELREAIAQRVSQKSRDEWSALFAETDACVAPVLDFAEAAGHPHNVARRLYAHPGRPGPAPRFSRTTQILAATPEAANESALLRFGLSKEQAVRLAGLSNGDDD